MSRKSHKRELFRMAFKMFILKSFDGVSIPDIEKATGFTRGTIFHYVIETYVAGVEQTMESLWDIIGRDVPKRDCSRAYLNMISQVSVLLPDVYRAYQDAMAKEEKLWMEVIGRGVENGELQNDVQPTILAKIMMSLFYGRAFQDSLIDGMDPKLLKEEMLAVYERVKKR